jgi:hypothetical protein
LLWSLFMVICLLILLILFWFDALVMKFVFGW